MRAATFCAHPTPDTVPRIEAFLDVHPPTPTLPRFTSFLDGHGLHASAGRKRISDTPVQL